MGRACGHWLPCLLVVFMALFAAPCSTFSNAPIFKPCCNDAPDLRLSEMVELPFEECPAEYQTRFKKLLTYKSWIVLQTYDKHWEALSGEQARAFVKKTPLREHTPLEVANPTELSENVDNMEEPSESPNAPSPYDDKREGSMRGSSSGSGKGSGDADLDDSSGTIEDKGGLKDPYKTDDANIEQKEEPVKDEDEKSAHGAKGANKGAKKDAGKGSSGKGSQSGSHSGRARKGSHSGSARKGSRSGSAKASNGKKSSGAAFASAGGSAGGSAAASTAGSAAVSAETGTAHTNGTAGTHDGSAGAAHNNGTMGTNNVAPIVTPRTAVSGEYGTAKYCKEAHRDDEGGPAFKVRASKGFPTELDFKCLKSKNTGLVIGTLVKGSTSEGIERDLYPTMGTVEMTFGEDDHESLQGEYVCLDELWNSPNKNGDIPSPSYLVNRTTNGSYFVVAADPADDQLLWAGKIVLFDGVDAPEHDNVERPKESGNKGKPDY